MPSPLTSPDRVSSSAVLSSSGTVSSTLTAVLKELGLSTGSTGSWKKGQLPKGDILLKISQHLDTSIDYIVTGEFRSDLTDDEKELIEAYRSAPEKAKYKILCDLERIVEEEIENFADKKGTG